MRVIRGYILEHREQKLPLMRMCGDMERGSAGRGILFFKSADEALNHLAGVQKETPTIGEFDLCEAVLVTEHSRVKKPKGGKDGG